jgi:hypothetical protein
MVSVQFSESVRRHIPTRNRLEVEVGRLSECTKLSLLRCNDAKGSAKGSAPKWLAIGEPFCSSALTSFEGYIRRMLLGV